MYTSVENTLANLTFFPPLKISKAATHPDQRLGKKMKTSMTIPRVRRNLKVIELVCESSSRYAEL